MEDTDGVGEKVNTFLLPNLSLASVSEVVPAVRRWDTTLEINMLTIHSDTTNLLQRQRIVSIVRCEEDKKIMQQWSVLLDVILGPLETHPTIYELTRLIDVAKEVNYRLQAQVKIKKNIPEDLIRLIKDDLDESFP